MKKLSIVFLCSLIHTLAFSQIPTAGLLDHYPFCGNVDNLKTTAVTATAVNATLVQDRFTNPNSAYYFNGTSSYIGFINTNIYGLSYYSYSMWVKPTASPASNAYVFYIGAANSVPKGQFLTYTSGSGFSAYSYNSGGPSTYVSSGSLPPNVWYHVVVTRDNGYISLYINGVKKPQNAWALHAGLSADYGPYPSYKLLGTYPTVTSMFTGVIDNVRFYSTTLTQANVTALFNEGQVPNISISSDTICNGENFVFAPLGASTYTYPGGSKVITPQSTDNYIIRGTNANGCIGSASITVTVEDCTALNEAAGLSSQLKLYPNPGNGHFILSSNKPFEGASLLIYDLYGKLVDSVKLPDDKPEAKIQANLLPGCYIGKLMIKGRLAAQQKIVIQD